METVFEAKEVFKTYGSYLALDNINLSVPKGSIFGLLGPNGAGKTSLIRIINQITAPDSGKLFFNGQALNKNHVERIGYLPEERGLYRQMKVGEQAMYLCQLKGLSESEARKKLKYWFEKFDITSWWDKKIEELSKGMAQKIQFIVTVLHEPELLIFDEPFSGFDPVNANLIKDEILELNKKGASIIFSTHRMESVEELCEYIALINKGKLVLDGELNAVKAEYRNHIWEVVVAGNMEDLPQISGYDIKSKEYLKQQTKLEIFDAESKGINPFIQALLQNNILLSVREILPSVNEIFIHKVTQKA
jgi:ABC-2 type transport system ATP-binding protein